MADVKKAPTQKLINKMAEAFSEDKRLESPDWLRYVKAGIHKEKAWEQPDWYYRRLASTLRKVYVMGPIGISRLSAEYGGRVDSGSRMYHPGTGSRAIVRHMLETLEKIGYVKKNQRGRQISPQGQAFIDKAVNGVMKAVVETDKSMEKYL